MEFEDANLTFFTSDPPQFSRPAQGSSIHGFVPLLMPVVRPGKFRNPAQEQGVPVPQDFQTDSGKRPQILEMPATPQFKNPSTPAMDHANYEGQVYSASPHTEDYPTNVFDSFQHAVPEFDDDVIPGVVYTVENSVGSYHSKSDEKLSVYSVDSAFQHVEDTTNNHVNNQSKVSPAADQPAVSQPTKNETAASDVPEPELDSSPALTQDRITSFSSLMLRSTGKIIPAVKPRYHLYTRRSQNAFKELLENDVDSLESFESSRDTKFIIHGYMDGVNITNWQKAMKDEFLEEGNYNVVLMDWSPAAEISFYESVLGVPPTGLMLARMIAFLANSTNLKGHNVHLIGHGLGAHVAGVAGHLLPGLARITALDPTGPGVEEYPEELRLSHKDAKFVDAIHTNGGTSSLEGIGTLSNCGHVDFFVNGGTHQDGCRSSLIQRLSNYTIGEGLLRTAFCDHFLSVSIFTDSIRSRQNPPPCLAFRCDSFQDFQQGRCTDCGNGSDCAIVGYRASEYAPFANRYNGTAKFFFATRSVDPPYCGYNYGVQMHLSKRIAMQREEAIGMPLGPGPRTLSRLMRGKVTVKLRSKKGGEVEVEFDGTGPEGGFEPGSNYTRVISSSEPIAPVDIILATWHPMQQRMIMRKSGGSRPAMSSGSTFRFPLDFFHVTPMSISNISERMSQSSQACSSCKGEGLPPDSTAVFFSQACPV